MRYICIKESLNMVIEFEIEYLRELYENGKTTDKKHRFQPQIVKQYVKVISRLEIASNLEELFQINSLNYEKLSGNKEGLESVRVNNQYRIEFKSNIQGIPPKTIIICSIVELSNHYK
jgi:proteic killer suppression protein